MVICYLIKLICGVKIKNIFATNEFNKEMYILSNQKINSFTCDKESFFGNGSIIEPDALYKNLDNEDNKIVDSCVGIEMYIKLTSNEEKDINLFILEEEKGKIDEDYYKKFDFIKELDLVKNNWNDILTRVEVNTPSDEINLLMNGWLMYQTLSSRINAKTGFYQSGGAFGFRDQLQDTLALKYIDSDILKNQIINCARHQFEEGDVLHWWHPETKKGIRTKISDDSLWLVYATLEYIEYENNYEILDENIEYLKAKKIEETELEKYDVFYESNKKDSLYNHLVLAIENLISKDFELFPKIGTGDWNDGFNCIGKNGKGESVWLGFFLCDILERFLAICEYKNDLDNVQRYQEIISKLKKNLNTKGWDGRWFKRAIDDNQNEIGSINCDECRIDSISQTWAVISNVAENDKKYIAMEELENYLVDKENQIIKLFDPPFEKTKNDPGYVKKYPRGIRENGGQYTHAACWVIIAEAMLGFGDKAFEYAKMINPINHSKTRDECKKYKLEPYIMEADIYSNENLLGRGGWNWYTGSSAWYYKAILEYILGLKIKNGKLKIEPCIPKNWKNFEINFKYKRTIYNIKVKNQNSCNTGVTRFLLNGVEKTSKEIELVDDCKINKIEIFM